MTADARWDEAEMDAVLAPRISVEELDRLIGEAPPLNRMCSGCAYRPGTDAATSPPTIAQREICDRAGHPFWCHMHKDRLGMPVHLCAGWIDKRAVRQDAPEPSTQTHTTKKKGE